MYLKVIGNAHEAAQVMGTKAILTKGQTLSGPESVFKELAQKYPELFKEVQEEANVSPLMPQKNKLVRPTSQFKKA